MKVVRFYDEEHLYKCYNVDEFTGEETYEYNHTSVTRFCEQFHAFIDWEYWKYHGAIKRFYFQEYNENKQRCPTWDKQKEKFKSYTTQMLIEWIGKHRAKEIILVFKEELDVEWSGTGKKAAGRGTKYHNYKENEASAIGVGTIGTKVAWTEDQHIYTPDYKQAFDLNKLSDGFKPETLLYVHEIERHGKIWPIRLAGQSDKNIIETINGYRFVDVDDWKTNAKFTTYNFFKTKMIYPFDSWHDCHLNHYKLQLNVYAWMFKQHGFIPRNLQITHVNFDLDENENPINELHTVYPINYYDDLIETMIAIAFNIKREF